MIGLSGYGYIKGNIYKIIGGVDGAHNICGASPGYEDYKNLYLTNLDTLDTGSSIF